MAKPSSPPPPPLPSRAQLLTAEHSGLVAARSSAQSEVLTRITIFLTLFSASLVSIALVGQATGFGELFGPSSIAILTIVVVIGQLTQIRVITVGLEDLMYVLAMNRLRAGYLEIDPGLRAFLMTSPHDDQEGSNRTYDFLSSRHPLVQVGGSSMMLIIVVNGILLGLLAAAICLTAGAPTWVTFGTGAVVAIGSIVFWMMRGERGYRRVWTQHVPVHPSPAH